MICVHGGWGEGLDVQEGVFCNPLTLVTKNLQRWVVV